jgi:DNA helicase-2/ATP-dependent DNA helicase PcrA
MYVGITRAKKRLYLSRAEERMMYNNFNHNPPSRFLDEIPARLIQEEYSESVSYGFGSYGSRPFGFGGGSGRGYGNGYRRNDGSPRGQAGAKQPRDEWADEFTETVFRKPKAPADLGKPKLKIHGMDLNSIPGVSRGFVGSAANSLQATAMQKLFGVGDKVRHPKFGTGEVLEVSGSGADARIRILFSQSGEKTLALAVAPIVKVEEEE